MIIRHNSSKFDVTSYKTILGHIKGLMLKKIKNDGALLIFKECDDIAVHTFFVFYKLDIFYLNNELEVTRIERNVAPFSILRPSKAKYILELKSKNNIILHDRIST